MKLDWDLSIGVLTSEWYVLIWKPAYLKCMLEKIQQEVVKVFLTDYSVKEHQFIKSHMTNNWIAKYVNDKMIESPLLTSLN